MILVVGSTGFLGGEICRRLIERGQSVRALVRGTSDPQRVERLRALGAQTVVGDLKDRASLDAACAGVSAVISTATSIASHHAENSFGDVDERGQLHLVDAAAAAGVGQFIYLSFTRNIEVDSPLLRAKRGVESHLKQSGLRYTILRPSVFMEVWLSPRLGFDAQQGAARIFGTGEQRISYISLGDVAEFAVTCLGNPAAVNAVLELGGPDALSPHAVVRTFEEVTGKQFDVQHVPEAALEEQWRNASDPLQKTFAALTLGVSRGDVVDMKQTLEQFPLRLTSVREYAERVAGS